MDKLNGTGTPLAGVRVIDLTTVVFGPYASQLLADYGADVIKIESAKGDSTRNTGPSLEPGMAVSFMGFNRNKRSVVLDIKKPAHKEALLAMIDGADVFMHNVRPQKLKALGLDPGTVMARNPSLIYAGLHGYGQNGSYSGRPAYDDIIQGLSGMASLSQKIEGQPKYVPSVVADKTCGIYAAMAISMALVNREKTGKGHFIEVPMFESMAGFTLLEHMHAQHYSPALGEFGYTRLLTKWRKPYQTADGYICVVPYTDAHWKALFVACGRHELAADARFSDISSRTRNIDFLYNFLSDEIVKKSSEEWLKILGGIDIPAAKLNSMNDLLEDPHLSEVGFFREIKDPKGQPIRVPDAPVRFNDSSVVMKMPPRLGEHTDEVLSELGISL